MDSFLTLEDINTVNIVYPVDTVHAIDMNLINTMYDFEDVYYDFVKISHRFEDNQHKFTFKIYNELWTGGFYFVDYNEVAITDGYEYLGDNTLEIVTNSPDIKLYLFMSSLKQEKDIGTLTFVVKDPIRVITRRELGTTQEFESFWWTNHGRSEGRIRFTAKEGVVHTLTQNLHVLFLLRKTDLVFDLTTTLTVGKVNHVQLGVDVDYLPDGAMVDGAELDAIVKYNGLEIPVVYDAVLNDYCFDLDLTSKNDNKPVKLQLVVNESKYIKKGSFKFSLNSQYTFISSFEELQYAINENISITRLNDDLVFDNDLIVNNPCLIIGNNKELDLNNYSILIQADNVKIIDCAVVNGSPAFIQSKNTKLSLENVKFEDCIITDEYKGSIVSTLSDENIITNLTECIILNCPHSIYHNGELTVNDCKALFNNFDENIDVDYALLLNQFDGECTINSSVFDIDLTGLCNDEINIKFASALLSIGENAVFNTVLGKRLKIDNSLDFFEYPFNNRSHIYIEYYYPSVDECVILSPVNGFEDKSLCHSVIGSDFIFKNNVQLTRRADNLENTNRTINWG